MQPLFFEPTLEFEKTAAQTQLPEDPNAWPTEVLQELYKQAPYIADFSPHVVMEKVDGEQGYGLGHVEVGNQTEIQTSTSPEMSAAAGVRQVRIPVVIKDGMLQPFDLLVTDDSKVTPLTETRIRTAIFRPQAFDVTSRTPGDQSMIGQLYPPYRQNQGFGGGGTLANVGMGKEGSALEEFLTKSAEGHCRGCEGGMCKCSCAMCKTACATTKTAGAFQDFGNQFLSADYLHANVGTKQARAGKRTAEGEHRPGMLDEFIAKTAAPAATPEDLADIEIAQARYPNQAVHPAALPVGLGSVGATVGMGIGEAVGGNKGALLGGLGGAGLGAVGGHLWGKHHNKRVMENAALDLNDPQIVARYHANPDGTVTKIGSLLRAILPTLNDADVREFKQVISSPELQGVLYKNAQTITPFIQMILERPQRQKTASVFTHLLQPSVVQLKRLDEGYRVKAASHLYWAPISQTIDRGEALARFGEKVVLAADLSGAVTLADDASAMEPPPEEHDMDLGAPGPVTEPGLYKVQTPEGETVVGYVIPNLIDIDGTALPLALFTNGSVATVQTDVVGSPAEDTGEQLDLPTADVPRGRGVFATSDGPLGPQATVPLTIDATLAGIGEGEPMSFRAESFSGEQVLVSRQPNIQTVTSTDGKMLVPDSWEWVPLDHAEEVAVESQEDGLKMASLERELGSIRLVSGGGGTFSFRGDHVTKLGHDEREMLGIDDAMFLLAGLGVDQDYGVRKIAEASTGLAPVRVRVGREIKLASDERSAATERARSILDSFPVAKQQLFKEAAVLGDPTAVDTVLSLGFLNPENLNTFIGYLPLLEDAQCKLCDILLASRLGNLIDTPEGAIERAVRSTEAVLEGLKALAFQNN
jgi:hypothetical protein